MKFKLEDEFEGWELEGAALEGLWAGGHSEVNWWTELEMQRQSESTRRLLNCSLLGPASFLLLHWELNLGPFRS